MENFIANQIIPEIYVKEEPVSPHHNQSDKVEEKLPNCKNSELSLSRPEEDLQVRDTQHHKMFNSPTELFRNPSSRSNSVTDDEDHDPLYESPEEGPCQDYKADCAQFCEATLEGDPYSPKEGSDYDSPDDLPRSDAKAVSKTKKLYGCPKCKKKFETSATLNRHVVKRHNITLGQQFTCHVCGAVGSSRSTLKRHLRRTHKITDFEHPQLLTRECAHCGDGFSSHSQLSSHLREFHPDKLDIYYHCHCCSALMSTKASLIRHLSRSHPGEEKAFLTKESCSICEQQFPHQPALQKHMKQDHPEALLHTCSECNAAFKYGYLLNRHKLTHKAQLDRQKRRQNLFCDYCGRKFNSEGRIERHIQVMHLNPQPKIYHCKVCDVTFPTTKQGIRHYRRVHLKERQKIRCSKCDITFESQEECMKHRVLHPSTCDICQKQFLRRDSLREHLLIHSDPRHQCPHCPKKFTQSSNLKRHIRTHTGEKPYTCPYCNRRFSDKSACNSHIRVHTGAERSVCNICGVSFSKRQRLNYHMRIHTGEGLLYCPLCGRPNTHSYSFRKHVESHRLPLTKALTVLGYASLMDEGNDIVLKALNLLAEVTLENSGATAGRRKASQPESEEADRSSRGERLPSTMEDAGDPLQTVLIKTEEPDEWERNTKDPMPSPRGKDEDRHGSGINGFARPVDPQTAISRLLHEILKLYNADLNCDEKLKGGDHAPLHLPGHDQVALEEPKAGRPMAVGDDLIKHCLDVIMKDEPIDPDEARDESDKEQAFDIPFVDSGSWQTAPHIKKEEEEWSSEHSSVKEEEFDSLSSPSDTKPFAIPKIKISRKVTKESGNKEPIFVAEFISS